MNNQKSKRPAGPTTSRRRKTAESIRRLENDLYFDTDNIKTRLTRIEEKLAHVATRDDLKDFATREDFERFKITMHGDMERYKVAIHGDLDRLRTELTAHSNTLFRWTVGIMVSGVGVILTVLKLT